MIAADRAVRVPVLAGNAAAVAELPAQPELGDRFMEILRAIHGDMPDDFADSARLAFVDAVQEPLTLTDEQIDAACRTVPSAIYTLMHGHETTPPVFRKALREVARAVLAAAQGSKP